MSYDLYLFRPPPRGDALAAARAAFEGNDSALPVAPASGWRERMHALAAALAAADPTLVREDAETGTDDERVELYAADEEGSGLQVLLFPDSAFVHVPFWHSREEARGAWGQAWRCMEVLEREGGLRTYDPQQERLLDLADDLDAVLAGYARGVEAMAKIPVPAPPPTAPARPWWKLWG